VTVVMMGEMSLDDWDEKGGKKNDYVKLTKLVQYGGSRLDKQFKNLY